MKPMNPWLNSTKSGRATKRVINAASPIIFDWRSLFLACIGVLGGFGTSVSPISGLGIGGRLVAAGIGVASLALAIACYKYMKNSNKWNW